MSGLALVVDRRGATLEEGNHQTVVVRHADGTRERVGIKALSSVVLNGDVMVSTHLLRMLAQEGVGVVLLPIRGLAQSVGFTRLPHGMTTLRHAQHLIYADARQRLTVARQIVLLKLQSQKELQVRLGCTLRHDPSVIADAVNAAPNIAALMGLEGGHAQQHFACIGARLDAAWRFTRRTRQPPRDPVNALLSLGYTLAQEAVAQMALRHGLDLEVGFLHGIQRTRPSLALDLLEPARAAVEEWVIALIAPDDGQLTPAAFCQNSSDGCRLEKAGRADFYRCWFAQGQARAVLAARPGLATILRALRQHRSDKNDNADGAEDSEA